MRDALRIIAGKKFRADLEPHKQSLVVSSSDLWRGESLGFSVMASLVSSVCLFSSPCGSRTKCSVSQQRAELVPSVSNSSRRQQLGLGQDWNFAIAPVFGRRGPRLSSVRRSAGESPGDDDESTKRDAGSSESKFNDTVDEIQKALGEAFGGTLWFAVLLTLLALFGGGYVYLIYNYADFTDIPILNGPQRGF